MLNNKKIIKIYLFPDILKLIRLLYQKQNKEAKLPSNLYKQQQKTALSPPKIKGLKKATREIIKTSLTNWVIK